MDFIFAWLWVGSGAILSVPTLLLLHYFRSFKRDKFTFDDYLIAFVKCVAFGPGTIVFTWPMFSAWLKVRKG